MCSCYTGNGIAGDRESELFADVRAYMWNVNEFSTLCMCCPKYGPCDVLLLVVS